MANTDNPETTRLENRLARLGQAKQTLEIVRKRLVQIQHRAPQLQTIIQGGFDNLDEALTEIGKEFEETRRERWPARKEEG